jgi:predicted ATPase
MSDALSPLGDTRAHRARWHLRLLGDVALDDGRGGVLRLPGRAATALLARLALAPARALGREALIELLWPGVAMGVGRNRLRQLLSTLKSLLDAPGAGGAVLLADRLVVRLGEQALACDAADFEAALRAGRRDEARALYRGELLPGFYDEWIHDERLRLAALAERLAPGAAVAGPAAEPAVAAPVHAAVGPTVLNLPHYLTQLHGADAVGAQLRAKAQAQRLVTLLGPGGQGKTRLAVEVAHSLVAPQRRDEPRAGAAALAPFDLVAFVPLVACAGGAALPGSLLAALLLALRQDSPGAAPLDHLQRLLSGRRTLLLLDNFEQLVDGGAPVVAELLARCPRLHLLVTSRRALGLDGEHGMALPALPLPALDDAQAALNPAVALFVDRARAVRADFHLGARNRAAVLALVHHLQGMPLAIELAASRLRSLSPAVLLELLQAALPAPADATTGALQLLSRGGQRAAGDPRHASMLTVVQWSWQLLSSLAQRLLPRLSVFAGNFSLAAAQALGDERADTVALALDELVAHSLLRSDAEGERYELNGLLREFAASALPVGEAAPLRARHRQWLTHWFAALPLSTPLQRVRPELANLAAAILGAEADGAPADAAALAAAAQTALSAISLPPPVLAALQRCCDALTDPVARAVTRAGLARTLLLVGQTSAAERLAAQAWAELPAADTGPAATNGSAPSSSPPGLARALVLTRVAHVRWRLHRDDSVCSALMEALALAQAADAPALQATILTNLGALQRAQAPAASIALQRRALALWAAAGDAHGVNVGRCNLALALAAQRVGAAEALVLTGKAMRDTRTQGDELQHALACNLAGEAWSRLCRWPEAAAAYRACIATAYAAAEPWPLVYGLWNLARPCAHARRPETAARLMGFAEQHTPRVTGPLSHADRHDLRRLRRLCERQADADSVAHWWCEGAALELSAAVQLALQDAG